MTVARLVRAVAFCSLFVTASCSQSGPAEAGAGDASALALPGGPEAAAARPAVSRSKEIQVVVRLADPPVAAVAGEHAKQGAAKASRASQKAHGDALRAKQDDLVRSVRALGGSERARLRVALNAVVVSIPPDKIAALAALPGVTSVRPVRDYEKDLTETVPYVGAAAVQAAGVDGRGVRVAVLDSGIDYVHRNLGGSGVVADFTANDETVVEPGTFPTAKVVGGFDFVGSHWPQPPPRATACPPAPEPCPAEAVALEPDPDPLDKCPAPQPGPNPADPNSAYPCNSGHGTHVADIIGGKSQDGTHAGVAPGASLYAVKVCSSTTTSCSGVALLQGMEFALDPDGDGDVEDAVDVVNMSLGSPYGQREDDLSAASANAVRLGVVVVASAGNNADRPFIVGSPSSTPEVISVAQTQVPSAKLYRIVAGSATAGGSWQPWSAAPALVSGALQYGDGAGGNLNGCAAFAAGSLSGKVVLVDRGVCAISIKVSNVAGGGGLAAVVANNQAQAPGDLPPDFSFGGGTPTVAGYSITRADGTLLKGVLGQTATIDPASAASLAKTMVSSSSRGPSFSFAAVKPDLGAPGASVSAEFGTGDGETAFGGTSGAAPMVTGAVALLLQVAPSRTPYEIKSILMNTAEPGIGINPVALPGVLAPITRIGGGELRVDRAFAARTAAWDRVDRTGSLSFGYRSVSEPTTLERTVTVRNYASATRVYAITPLFRYADDAASGAVTIDAPTRIRVGGRSSESFTVKLRIDPSKLPLWGSWSSPDGINGGARGGDGFRLQRIEFDGYVRIQDAQDDVRVAWQVLPHRSAAVNAGRQINIARNGTGSLELENDSRALDGQVEVFSLTGTSPQLPPPGAPVDGSNLAVTDLAATGVRPAVDAGGAITAVQFAVDTFGRRAHPAYPAEFDVFLDVDRDGKADFVVFNLENGGGGVTGQTVVAAVNLTTGTSVVRFFADADLESGNAVLTALLPDVGLAAGTQFDFVVAAFDNYFSGQLTDSIGDLASDDAGNVLLVNPMTYTLGAPRYASAAAITVPARGEATLAVTAPAGGAAASPSQLGLLLLYRDARESREAEAVLVRR